MSVKKTEEEIKAVWLNYKASNCDELRDELITHYLQLVKQVVGRVSMNLPSHVNAEDLYSTGVMGLIKAVEKYDPTMKNKFSTYASLLIRGAIIDELRSLDWVPRSVHQKANKIADTQQNLQTLLGREPTDRELAKELGISVKELEELYDKVKPAVLLSLNADNNDDSEQGTLAERIPDLHMQTSFEEADQKEFRKLLEKAVMELPEQERSVLVLYYYENLMLKEIGKIMKVSESRISQIHAKAIMRLRGRLREFMKEFADLKN